jgi:hypothetical protein
VFQCVIMPRLGCGYARVLNSCLGQPRWYFDCWLGGTRALRRQPHGHRIPALCGEAMRAEAAAGRGDAGDIDRLSVHVHWNFPEQLPSEDGPHPSRTAPPKEES